MLRQTIRLSPFTRRVIPLTDLCGQVFFYISYPYPYSLYDVVGFLRYLISHHNFLYTIYYSIRNYNACYSDYSRQLGPY